MMRKIIPLFLTCLAAIAADDGASVVVVYNSNSSASKDVAEHYARKRAVPSEQVIGLPLSEKEIISRDEYQNKLAEPLLRKLEDLKLISFHMGAWTNAAGKVEEARLVSDAKIRYAALCYGVPLKIEQDNSVHEPAPEKTPPEALRNEAAVDNELALLPVYHAKPALNGPIMSRFYAATNLGDLQPRNGLLMVARLDGPTAEIARGLVDKAVEAEQTGLWGRAYFDMRGLTNGGYKVGDDMLRAAEVATKRLGYEIVEDSAPNVFSAGTPMPQIGIYAGWYEYNVSGALAQPSVEFMPGAFAYHLHSFSGETIRSATERWVGPLLAKGVTCTLGSVYEPFLQGTPDIAVFLNRWFFDGATFAEAAYTAQRALSWETTVVGDPLYRPFAKKPQEMHEQLEKAHSKLIEWSLLRVININLWSNLPVDEAIKFLLDRPETKTSALLNEKLGDLYKSKGKWIDAMEPYERALTLNPTPQQRLRISFTVANMQVNFDRGRQAFEIYQGLLKDFPDYPDRLRIYQKILPLADKFGKPGEAAEYQKALQDLKPKT